MSKNIFFMSFLYVFIACTLFLSSIVHSASIREDMAARIPAIDALKFQGIVGENNKGCRKPMEPGSGNSRYPEQ